MLVACPAAAGAVQELDLDRFGLDVGAQPVLRSGSADGLTWWDEADELGLAIFAALQRYIISGLVAGSVKE